MSGHKKKTVVINGYYNSTQRKIIKTAFEYMVDVNPNNKSRHVSIICLKGETICVGINNEKASFSGRPFGYLSIHSEYSVLKKFLSNHYAGQLHQYDLWNIRINRYNEIVNSKPCKRCQYVLGIFTPRRIFYSNENGDFEQWLS